MARGGNTRRVPAIVRGGAPASAGVSHNLPAFATSFVGRIRELRELTGSLGPYAAADPDWSGRLGQDAPVVRACGPTSLSRPATPDGVWLVELAGITEPALVASALATTLRLSLPGGRRRPPRLATSWSIDGCSCCSTTASTCSMRSFRSCSSCWRAVAICCLLATSREPLGISGEVAWRVPSLELPRNRRRI